MAAKMSVPGLTLSCYLYLRSEMVLFPLSIITKYDHHKTQPFSQSWLWHAAFFITKLIKFTSISTASPTLMVNLSPWIISFMTTFINISKRAFCNFVKIWMGILFENVHVQVLLFKSGLFLIMGNTLSVLGTSALPLFTFHCD